MLFPKADDAAEQAEPRSARCSLPPASAALVPKQQLRQLASMNLTDLTSSSLCSIVGTVGVWRKRQNAAGCLTSKSANRHLFSVGAPWKALDIPMLYGPLSLKLLPDMVDEYFSFPWWKPCRKSRSPAVLTEVRRSLYCTDAQRFVRLALVMGDGIEHLLL